MSPFILTTPLPASNPTSSYWLSDPHPTLTNYRASENVPDHVDTVIIGSGISGALIAHGLLTGQQQKDASVLMLEARSIASGASGRNGGHIKPDCYKNYSAFEDQYGSEVAKTLCRYEVECMDETVRFIQEQGLDEVADLAVTRSVDFFLTEASWRAGTASIDRYRAAGGDLSQIRVHEAAEAKQLFRLEHAYGAVSYPACSLWPWKVVVGTIEKSISRGLKLFTHTPALEILPSQGKGRWLVKTSRGDVSCNTVFHATNGYISNLVPDLAGKIIPCKGNVVAVKPNETWLANPLGHTAGIQWGEDFDYMIQRPTDGKPLIFGGRDLAHPRGPLGALGDADDSTTTPEIMNALIEFPKRYMKDWTSDKASVSHAWSGIMGFTADELPFVGELPGRPGQYLSAGYTGHGMARVFLCIQALLQIVRGEAVDARVPKPYLNVEERMQKRDRTWETLTSKAYNVDGGRSELSGSYESGIDGSRVLIPKN